MKYSIAAALLTLFLSSVCFAEGKSKPVPGLPAKTLIANIAPGNDNSTAFGTVRTTSNKDGSFLVSLDLNLQDSDGNMDHVLEGYVLITVGSNCNPTALPESLDSLLNPSVELRSFKYEGIGEMSSAISKSAFRMNNGFSMKSIRGKAVHIFNSDPNNLVLMGCGIFEKEVQEKTLVAKMGTYPGYEGELDASGKVTVTFNEDDTFTFSYKLKGLKQNCVGCGIHIHAGTSCDTHEQVKGHGWNSLVVQDLWTAAGGATYDTNDKGKARGYFNIFNGYGYEENEGHAVVIHTQDGARVGCGVLEAQ